MFNAPKPAAASARVMPVQVLLVEAPALSYVARVVAKVIPVKVAVIILAVAV
jgi:hypothetical protein